MYNLCVNYIIIVDNSRRNFEIIYQYDARIMSSFRYKKIVYDLICGENRDKSSIH